jgi:hypothetical protein
MRSPHVRETSGLFQLRLQQLKADDIVVLNEITGPQSLVASLTDLFKDYLAADAAVENTLRDSDYLALINRVLDSANVERFISGTLYEGDKRTPIDQQSRATFFSTVCRLVIEHEVPGMLDAALAEVSQSHCTYKTFSLADRLHRALPPLRRVGALWAAAFLFHDELSHGVQAPETTPLPPPLDLRGYQDLHALMSHLLADQPGDSLCIKLLNLLPMDLLRVSSGEFRPATLQEIAAGADLLPDRQDRMAFFPGATLSHPADVALEALLNCAPFAALQHQLIEALEWYNPEDPHLASTSMARQLTIQALIDCIYPPHQRRIGYLLDFHLFAQANADCSLYDLRINLSNSLRRTLGCQNADAQIIMQLLATRFAPELLLSDAPDDFRYQPDLRWVNLRHAMTLDSAAPQSRTFVQWEALPATLAAQATTVEEKLHIATTRTDAMIVWNLYNHHVTEQPYYSADDIARMSRYFGAACDRQALNDPPDRLNDARRLLLQARINPDAPNTFSSGTTTELEAYLDDGTAYRPSRAVANPLPDATRQFDQAFDRYLTEARQTFTQLMTLFLDDLPTLHRTRLLSANLRSYAVVWRQYVGPMVGAVPSIDSSPAGDWQDCRGGHGGVVHAEHEGQHWVYELFPERYTFKCTPVEAGRGMQLGDSNLAAEALNLLVSPHHERYNGVPLPYEKSDLSKAVPLSRRPGSDNQTHLVQSFVEEIFLHHHQALRETCKGATRREIATRHRQSNSDAQYAWKLIKSVVPLVGCVDVNTGGDALSCVADVADFADVAGPVMTIAGRALKPLIRLGNKKRVWSPRLPSPSSPRQQNGRWFAGQDAARVHFERRVQAAWSHVITGNFRQRGGMFQRLSDTGPTSDPAMRWAKVDNIDQVLVRNISNAETPDYRWCNPHDQKPYGPVLSRDQAVGADETWVFVTTQKGLLPGQFPGAVFLNEVVGHGHDLSVADGRHIRVVRRDQSVTDLIVDDVSYRFDADGGFGMLRKIELQPPNARLGQLDQASHCVIRRSLVQASCSGALVLLSTTRPALDPALEPLTTGEQASHAFMTHRFRPALRFTPVRGQAHPRQTHLLVDEGKVSAWVDEVLPARGAHNVQTTGRKILAALTPDAAVHLGITTPLHYRPTVQGRVMKDQTLGLTDGISPAWRERINQELPVVQLDSICKTVNDQRELRAIRLTLEDGPCIAVEADTGYFYRARELPGNTQLTFTRMTSEAEIDAYLTSSEGYRLGAGRRALNQDVDNVARLLFELENPGADMRYADPLVRSDMENHARNVFTNATALENFVTLTRSSITHFKPMSEVDPLTRQHVASVIGSLLPAPNSRHPWRPVSAADIALQTTGETIRKHLNTTNLAFLLAETSDHKHHVYYALAGGKRAKNLTLRDPATRDGSSTRFIDARERMRDQAPDPSFTSLPVLRTASRLKIREHDRYLDAERLIATAFKQDMPAAEDVIQIHFFTLMDTCYSCGGFVLPRLKLDYPGADFSVSYILPYTPPS